MKDYLTQPIGMIRHDELANILKALVMARPDLTEGVYLVAMATGLVEYMPPIAKGEQPKFLEKVSK